MPNDSCVVFMLFHVAGLFRSRFQELCLCIQSSKFSRPHCPQSRCLYLTVIIVFMLLYFARKATLPFSYHPALCPWKISRELAPAIIFLKYPCLHFYPAFFDLQHNHNLLYYLKLTEINHIFVTVENVSGKIVSVK